MTQRCCRQFLEGGFFLLGGGGSHVHAENPREIFASKDHPKDILKDVCVPIEISPELLGTISEDRGCLEEGCLGLRGVFPDIS